TDGAARRDAVGRRGGRRARRAGRDQGATAGAGRDAGGADSGDGPAGAGGKLTGMFVNFFIDRPIFASVLAIVIVVAGAVAIPFLPIARFPEITPPHVVLAATHPGASAVGVGASVTTPIEQQVDALQCTIYF